MRYSKVFEKLLSRPLDHYPRVFGIMVHAHAFQIGPVDVVCVASLAVVLLWSVPCNNVSRVRQAHGEVANATDHLLQT